MRMLAIGLAACLLCGASGRTVAEEYTDGYELSSADQEFNLKINNRAQIRWFQTDPDVGSSRGSFDLAQYKLLLSGTAFGDWEFRFQTNLAGGSEDDSELLEDASVKWAAHSIVQVWAGQGKVAFGRQELTSSGRLQFVDRSIASERFAGGRDVGVAVVGRNLARTYEYSAGVYSGSGINKDEDDNKGYMAVARLVFTPFGEFELDESSLDFPDGPQLAIGVAALSNTIGTEGIEEEHLSRGGLEVAFKYRGFNVVGEFFSESRDPLFAAETDIDGWYLQSGYLLRCGVEFAARYSEILAETPGRDETEAGGAIGYYFKNRGHRQKIQADYRKLTFEATPFEDRKQIRLQLQIEF